MTKTATMPTAVQSLYHMEVSGNDWEQWRATMWNTIADGMQGHPRLAPLEQWMLRSRKEQRCVQCGTPTDNKQDSIIVASVSHYYICGECTN